MADGNYDGGVRHGEGTMKWTDGSSYEGAFKEGYMHGLGSLALSRNADTISRRADT